MTSRLYLSLCAALLGGVVLCGAAPVVAESCDSLRQHHGTDVVSVHCGGAPSATVDGNGRLWVAFVQNKHVWVAHSDDEGKTYSQPVQVNATPEDAEYNGENRPKILLSDEGYVLLSWTTKTSANFTGEIRFSRSTDGGVSFEEPRTINDDQLFTGHRFDSLFLTPSGTLYLTWIDKRDLEARQAAGEPYAGAAIYYAVSGDYGATFSQNVRVSHNSCECCRIAMAPHGDDNVAILWRQIFDDHIRDHAIAVLGPTGEVSQLNRATVDDWFIDACPHHGPTMVPAASEGSYHMSWFSAGNLHSGIHYARYDLDSGTTSNLIKVDGTPGAGHPFMARDGNRLYLVWKGFDGENTLLNLMESVDDGGSWSQPRTLLTTARNSDHPLLIETARGVFLSWHTDQYGYVFQALEDPAVSDNIQPFGTGTFAQLKAGFQGRPFLVSLWSVDCPPCRLELQMLGELMAEQPDFPLLLISTDDIQKREDALFVLEDYNLDHIESYMFADGFVERLRFSIDPGWYGELPRSYIHSADGQVEGHSGVLTRERIDAAFHHRGH
ncbi:MAG: hypothetical protein RLZZ385_1253 [Pseudomonadota bacterium]|jgi:thiol-disulfide isomerase/thioredoxin